MVPVTMIRKTSVHRFTHGVLNLVENKFPQNKRELNLTQFDCMSSHWYKSRWIVLTYIVIWECHMQDRFLK